MDKKDNIIEEKNIKEESKLEVKEKNKQKKLDDNNEISDISEIFKKREKKDNKVPNINNIKMKPYLSYSLRIIMFAFCFAILFSLSYFLVRKSFVSTLSTSVTYNETGSIDYKVMLKDNDFYESNYLSKGMVYITSLIKSIDITYDYRFMIDKNIDGSFNEGVVAKLIISNDSGDNVYYSKDYVLSPTKTEVVKDKNMHSLKKIVSIDYDYYNNLSNKFKSTYGVDSSSKLIVTYNVGGNVADNEIKTANNMSVTIPLSQRAINISDSGGVNNSKTDTVESKLELKHKAFIVVAIVLFICSVASLLKFLELIFAMFGKSSEYDKYLNKIFKEYDRLIVEVKSAPDFDGKNIIKIDKFEELLDARDTLKQPIIYFDVTSHVKSYFYITKGRDVYLLVIKAVDLEAENEKKNKKKNKK